MGLIPASHRPRVALQHQGLSDVFGAKTNSEIQKAGRILRLYDAAPKAVTAPQGWVAAGCRRLAAGVGAEGGPARGRKEMGSHGPRQDPSGGQSVFSTPCNKWTALRFSVVDLIQD